MSNPIADGPSLVGTSAQQLSSEINTARHCVIQITNHSYESLTEPNIYTHSGYCYSQPQPIINALTRDACSFSKVFDGASGAVGVLTYKLGYNSNKRLAIMFSVPYDFNFYDSWYGLGYIDGSGTASEELYNQMYYNSETIEMKRAKARDGTTLHVNSGDWKVSATMSDSNTPIMQIEIRNEGVHQAVGGQVGQTYIVTEQTIVYN